MAARRDYLLLRDGSSRLLLRDGSTVLALGHSLLVTATDAALQKPIDYAMAGEQRLEDGPARVSAGLRKAIFRE